MVSRSRKGREREEEVGVWDTRRILREKLTTNPGRRSGVSGEIQGTREKLIHRTDH